MKHWIDNADSYICPICGFETNNPNKYKECKCPKCGFQNEKDKDVNEKVYSIDDVINMFKDLQKEIEYLPSEEECCDYATDNCIGRYHVDNIIGLKIKFLEEEKEK